MTGSLSAHARLLRVVFDNVPIAGGVSIALPPDRDLRRRIISRANNLAARLWGRGNYRLLATDNALLIRRLAALGETRLVSRQVARREGRVLYFTGEPCLRGHIAARRVGNGTCTSCARETTAAHRAAQSVLQEAPHG